ncbi:MAG: cupin domain-containing protein [Frankia sp.]
MSNPSNGSPAGPGDEPAGRTVVPAYHEVDPFHRALHHVAPAGLDPETAQSSGMRRLAAISGKSVGARKLWMGQTLVSPSMASANHHHGESETAIYIVSGRPEFVFLEGEGDEAREVRVRTAPGDYIFVPPWVPHREENPDPNLEAVVVIARSTQEAVVVNLPDLRWAGPVLTTGTGT